MTTDSSKLIYDWNPLRNQLIASPFFVIIMLFGIWQASTPNPFYSPGCTGRGCITPSFIAFIGFVLVAANTLDILRTRRLEFYVDHVKLVGTRGSSDQNFRYDQVTVGALKLRLFGPLLESKYSPSFELGVFDPSTGRQVFYITDRWVEAADRRLYDWLDDKTARRKTSN